MSIKNIGLTLVGVAVAFTLIMAPASAQSIDDLNAMIAQLTAQLSALQGGAPASGSMTCPAPSLTIGSTGAGVTALQTLLVSKGYLTMPAGVAMGTFGPLTQSAVMKWQAAMGVSPASGYYGPITSAACNAMGGAPVVPPVVGGVTCPNGNLLSNNCMAAPSGVTCPNGNLLANNCMPGSTTGTPGNLQGGAGSVESYELISGLNNEEVGEGSTDVEVAGIEIEADDASDLQLTAVRLVFAHGTASSARRFDRFADEVSIWLDGEEVARVNASDFNRNNNYSRTVSLNSGAIIRGGDVSELTVAVSGVSNLDSGDAGKTWTVDFATIRFVDAQGASISEDPETNSRTFSFDTFASATGAEFRVALSNNNPLPRVVDVDDTNDTDDVELLRFTMEARGSEMLLVDLPITLTVTGATDVDAVANTLYAVIDGKRHSESISTSAAAATITFDDIDFMIDSGDKVEVVIMADINKIGTGFDEGDTIKAEYTATNRQYTVVEDETGEELAVGEKKGTALGNEQAFYDAGIMVTFLSSSSQITSNSTTANTNTGQMEVKFRVTAFDDTIYVADTSAATIVSTIPDNTIGADAIRYRVAVGGTATTAGLSALVTTSATSNVGEQSANGNVTLEDGESLDYTVTVTRTNTVANGGGIFQLFLQAVGWNTTDSATVYNVYDFNLENFKSHPLSIN